VLAKGFWKPINISFDFPQDILKDAQVAGVEVEDQGSLPGLHQ
jgi:hypothetical protein